MTMQTDEFGFPTGGGAAAPAAPAQGSGSQPYTEDIPGTSQYFIWYTDPVSGLLTKAGPYTKQQGSNTVVNLSTTSPASTGSLTIEDIQREVQAAGGKLTNYGGVWRAVFSDGSIVDYQPSAKDPKSGLQFYNPGVIVSQKGAAGTSPAAKAAAAIAQTKAIAAGLAGGQGGAAQTGVPQQPAAPAQAGVAGTPASNPMLGESLYGGRKGTDYLGTWAPAGGGSTLMQPVQFAAPTLASMDKATYNTAVNPTLSAMGITMPGSTSPEQRTAAEMQAYALIDQFGYNVASAMMKDAMGTGTLTGSEAGTPFEPETYAQGGSMTVSEPSFIQGILSGHKYGVLGASPERVSNITPLGNEQQQRRAGAQESWLAKMLGGAGGGMAPQPGVLPGEEPQSGKRFMPYGEGDFASGWMPQPRGEKRFAPWGEEDRWPGGGDWPIDRNDNGIDDREEEWTKPDGSKYKRKSRHEPIPRPTPPTPNVFAQGGSIAYNPQYDPLVLEMQARAINRRARKMLPKGMI